MGNLLVSGSLDFGACRGQGGGDAQQCGAGSLSRALSFTPFDPSSTRPGQRPSPCGSQRVRLVLSRRRRSPPRAESPLPGAGFAVAPSSFLHIVLV